MKNKKAIFWLVVILVLLYWYNARQNAAPQTETAAETKSQAQTEQIPEEDEQADEADDEDKIDEADKADKADEEKTSQTEAPADADFELAGEALGDGAVSFTWEFEEELKDDARFVLVRGEEENPELNSTNFWYRVHGSKRDAMWKNVPDGTYHFRLCQTDEKDGVCKRYSNDIELEVE